MEPRKKAAPRDRLVMGKSRDYLIQPRLMPMKTNRAMPARAMPTLIVPMFIFRLLSPSVENIARHGGHNAGRDGKPALRRDNHTYEQTRAHGHEKGFPIFHSLLRSGRIGIFFAPVHAGVR